MTISILGAAASLVSVTELGNLLQGDEVVGSSCGSNNLVASVVSGHDARGGLARVSIGAPVLLRKVVE